MRNTLLIAIVCLLPLTASAQDWWRHRDRLISDCNELDECLEILERTLPEEDNGGVFLEEVERCAKILRERFGRPAREKLIEKALGDHASWRTFAAGILAKWGDWGTDDVPRLRRILLSNAKRSYWAAPALGEVGTDEAIDALIEHLPHAGTPSPTSWALQQHAPQRILDRLFPLLDIPKSAKDDGIERKGQTAAKQLITRFESDAAYIAPEWAAIARSESEPISRRLAALHGLEAIGIYARKQGPKIRPLRESKEKEIANKAADVLLAMRDSSVAAAFAEACTVGTDKFRDFGSVETFSCLRVVSEFGEQGYAAGPHLMKMLKKTVNAAEQAYVIEALGLIRYKPAAGAIQKYVDVQDWRVVYAAVRSLGWLKARTALPRIKRIEQEHWLPELRELARLVRISLETGEPFEEPSQHLPKWAKHRGKERLFGQYEYVLTKALKCPSESWVWTDYVFSFKNEPNRPDVQTLQLEDGKLVGTDNGEWGGELIWKPKDGRPITLHTDNVIALLRTQKGPIAVFGLAHLGLNYGYILRLDRNVDGSWDVREIARLFGEPFRVKSIGNDAFAAHTEGRVVIFTRDGIQALADCVE